MVSTAGMSFTSVMDKIIGKSKKEPSEILKRKTIDMSKSQVLPVKVSDIAPKDS